MDANLTRPVSGRQWVRALPPGLSAPGLVPDAGSVRAAARAGMAPLVPVSMAALDTSTTSKAAGITQSESRLACEVFLFVEWDLIPPTPNWLAPPL